MSYHYTAFDWGPTVENDETKMLDYKTAMWASEQLNTSDFDKPFFMADRHQQTTSDMVRAAEILRHVPVG